MSVEVVHVYLRWLSISSDFKLALERQALVVIGVKSAQIGISQLADSDDAALTVNLLGPMKMRSGEANLPLPGRKPAALFAYLCRRFGTEVPRETLSGLLWGDVPDAQARASLRQALSALRKALGDAGDQAVTTGTLGLRVNPNAVQVDAHLFEAAIDGEGSQALAEAAGLYSGDFLEGANAVAPEFDRWLAGERAALRAQYMSVLTKLLEIDQEAGRHEDAIATANRLIVLDPLQESVHRRLMQSYAAQNRFDAALKQYADLELVLEAELGIRPETITSELAREIRNRRRGAGSQSSRAVDTGELRAPPAPAVPSRPSIAVLPFRALSASEEAKYFGEGVAEDVIIELSRDSDMMVVARQSSFQFDPETVDPREIGAALGVRYCLTGSIRTAGTRVRVSAHLIGCEDAEEIWADRFDRDLEDIFDIQTEIARTVTSTVIGRIVASGAERTRAETPKDMAAYDIVLLGLNHLYKFTRDSAEEARNCFAKAIAADPDYARPYGLYALAESYIQWHHSINPEVPEVIEYGEKCIARDPGDAKGHCALGIGRLIREEHARSGYHFEAALARNPNDDLVLIEHGRYLMYDDRGEEGIKQIREAMRLNPYHPDWYWNVYGRCLHTLGRMEEALEMFRRIRKPTFYMEGYLAACHAALGNTEKANEHCAKLYEAQPDFTLDVFAKVLPYRNSETKRNFMKTLEKAGFK